MVQIFYKKSGCNYSFCTTDYSFDEEHNIHLIDVNEGDVGMTYSFDPVMTKSYSEIEVVYRNIQTRYPDKQPDTLKIRLIIDLKDFVKTLSKKRIQKLMLHLRESARFTTQCSGQGIFDIPEPNRNTKLVDSKFEMVFDIIEKNSFFNNFFIHISYCGVKLEKIRIMDYY